MKKMRRAVLIFSSLLLLFLLVYKSTTVFISEWNLHKYRILAVKARDGGKLLTATEMANQYLWLVKAVKWAPKNSAPHFEFGRVLHRMAANDDKEKINTICDLAGIEKEKCNSKEFYSKAMEHYNQAITNNMYVSGARFWQLMALVALEDKLPPILFPKEDRISNQEIISRLEEAMKWEGQNPRLFLYAGDLAKRAGREDIAGGYYSKALLTRLDSTEAIVEKVALWDEGFAALEKIIPQTAVAQERLSKALVTQWRFDLAKEAWEKARRANGETVPIDPADNLVANGDFKDPMGSHFLGWKARKLPGVKIDFEPSVSGAIIKLDRGPKQYFHFSQIIPVEPNKTYRFSARVKPSGSELRSGSSFGFEVIHPYDFTIWSKGAGCIISQRMNETVCRNLTLDHEGYYNLTFEFTPGQPLRMIILRLVWKNDPDKGILSIGRVRIEPIDKQTEDQDAPASGSFDNNQNQE